MKGFIKITDVNNQEHYLNIDYIAKFSSTSEGHEGKAFIWLVGTQSATIYQTDSTPEEIVDMIELAKS